MKFPKIDSGLLEPTGLRFREMFALNREQRMQLLDIRNQPDIRRNMYNDRTIEQEEHLGWCNSVSGSDKDCILALTEQDEVKGMLGFRAVDWFNKRCDWAFFIDSSLQGRGIGSALEKTALHFVFRQLNFEKLNCEVLEFNKAVIRMHQKFGFQIEGCRRKHVIRENSGVDSLLLGITRLEYFDRKGPKV